MKRVLAFVLSVIMLCTCFQALAEEAPVFATIGEAADIAEAAMEEYGRFYFMANDGHVVVVVKHGEKFYRVVGVLDEKAEALYDSADSFEAYEAADEYAKTLPVAYIEELTAEPLDQAAIDAMTGKTVAELEEEGFALESYGSGGTDMTATLVYGMYCYDALLDMKIEDYLETDEVGDARVVSVRLLGPADRAMYLMYHADGTLDPDAAAQSSAEDFFSGEGSAVFMAIMEAIAAAENGEELDWRALLEKIVELAPEKEDEIRGILEMIPGLTVSGEAEGAN